ncbi:LIM/homeobox protein Lhx8-like [Antechinus flavipes]|uniref:LIM/homeobox protein Lhx8-like n=1 Tax=Antechinus flavipes TaxID=38775 RepID=UPI0022367170|nr:LIM/homeobox protein Lhx8-like [Antechinus flavipes]XP_051817053.1 LIM/homeobox protein Lhx8-like [Antechinus flavipes]
MSEECWRPAALAAERTLEGLGDGGLVIPEASAEEKAATEEEPCSSSALLSLSSSSLQSMGSTPEEVYLVNQVIPQAAMEEEPCSSSSLPSGPSCFLRQVILKTAAEEDPCSSSALLSSGAPCFLPQMSQETTGEEKPCSSSALPSGPSCLPRQVIPKTTAEEDPCSSSALLSSGAPCFLPQMSQKTTGEEEPCSSSALLSLSSSSLQSMASTPGYLRAKCVCSGCRLEILDKYLLKVNDTYWHMQCLCCSVCQASLGKHATCFIKDNTIFCKMDYLRKFGTCCCGCGRFIRSSDWVQKARGYVYHLACFVCFSCKRQLCTGDEFALVEEKVLCRVHYDGLMDSLKSEAENGNRISVEDALLLEDMKNPKPAKRARTNFTVDQLQIMQGHYTQENNPNAQALQKLSERTGLSRKTVQIWFQNCRARQKKLFGRKRSSTTLMKAFHSSRLSVPMLRQMPYRSVYTLQERTTMMALHGYSADPPTPLGLRTLMLPRFMPQLPTRRYR